MKTRQTVRSRRSEWWFAACCLLVAGGVGWLSGAGFGWVVGRGSVFRFHRDAVFREQVEHHQCRLISLWSDGVEDRDAACRLPDGTVLVRRPPR